MHSLFHSTSIHISVTGASASNICCDHPRFISCFSLHRIGCWWGSKTLGNVQVNNQPHQPPCFNCQLFFGGGTDCSSADPNISFSISFKSMWWSFIAFCKEPRFMSQQRYLRKLISSLWKCKPYIQLKGAWSCLFWNN
jgi:hypothetical protein